MHVTLQARCVLLRPWALYFPVQHTPGYYVQNTELYKNMLLITKRTDQFTIDDYAKDGGKELFTKMDCVL